MAETKKTAPETKDVVKETAAKVETAAKEVKKTAEKKVTDTKKAVEKAFRNQIEGKGFSLIEVVSACPTNWGLTPQKALQWVEDQMIPYYPLGVYKDRSEEAN